LNPTLTFADGYKPNTLGQTIAGDTTQNEPFLRTLGEGNTISFSGKYYLVGFPAPNGGAIYDVTNLQKGD